MGSVISYVECPRCKQENCISDYYYNTGEESNFCPDCGYHESCFFARDEQGQLIRKDESGGYDFDNLVMKVTHSKNPYAAYRVEWSSGAAEIGNIKTKRFYNGFIKNVNNLIEHDPDVEIVVSRLVDGKIEKEIINTHSEG